MGLADSCVGEEAQGDREMEKWNEYSGACQRVSPPAAVRSKHGVTQMPLWGQQTWAKLLNRVEQDECKGKSRGWERATRRYMMELWKNEILLCDILQSTVFINYIRACLFALHRSNKEGAVACTT